MFIRVLLFFLIISTALSAQVLPERAEMERMEKRAKWSKTSQSLRKSVYKDPGNPEHQYLLSLYFLSNTNPEHNPDSAHLYVQAALKNLSAVSVKERERLKRNSIDSIMLKRLSGNIDSVSFEFAKTINTEVSYQHFLDIYSDAQQRLRAAELRDEVAFINALKINSIGSFKEYVSKYPRSLRRSDAQAHYDRLVFDDRTKDRRVQSYMRFLEEFPSTPYRAQAENEILELSTASGLKESFNWFIDHYPDGKAATKARNILFHLQEDDDDLLSRKATTDSLAYLEKLNESYLVPVIKSGKFGFIDQHGNEILAPSFDSVSEEYFCGDVTDRLLVTSSGLISRAGAVVWKGRAKEIKNLGTGFIFVTSDSSAHVIHESGFVVTNDAGNARVIINRLIAAERRGQWSIYTLAGRKLTTTVYDDVGSFDSLLILSKSGKKILSTPQAIATSVRQEEFVFDDVRRWGPDQYWVRNGLLEGVVDGNLRFVIPLDRQQLKKTSFGFVRNKDGKSYIKGVGRFENVGFKNVTEQGGWLRLQQDENNYQLYDKALDRLVAADSVWFQGQMAFTEARDSISAYLTSGQRISFPLNTAFQIREFGDSLAWLLLDDRKRKVVYDATSGVKLFISDMDQLEPVSPELFITTKNNKKGLLSESGKIVLPAEYDAVVKVNSNEFSLLKDRKFGWYAADVKLLIKPSYERNIRSYNHVLKIAYKDKGYGFLHADGKPMGNFEWEEILYWNDSTALVKKAFQWILLDINSQEKKTDRIRSYTAVKDDSSEKIFIARQDNAFGVVSSVRGVIIPFQYSDIVNVGSRAVPLYFTERNIEEANISVVVYFDQAGKIIRKQALEADEFEKIACDN